MTNKPAQLMKPWIACMLLIAFIALGVFSAFSVSGMSHDGQEHGGCVASAAMGADCPTGQNPLSFAIFHLKAFASFGAAVFGDMAGLTVLLLAFALALVAASPGDRPGLAPAFASQRFLASQRSGQPLQQLHSWLALFEKRDPDPS